MRHWIAVASLLTALIVAGRGAHAAPNGCNPWSGSQFVSLSGGAFQMGADATSIEVENYEDEAPRHSVTVAPFCVMRDLLTVEELRALVRTTSSTGFFDLKTVLDSSSEGYVKADLATAKQIARYLSRISQLNVRLPTEAEWEYAARGGLVGKTFVWGNRGDTFRGRPVKEILLGVTMSCRIQSIEEIVGDQSLLACVKREMQDQNSGVDEYSLGEQSSCLKERFDRPAPDNGFGLQGLVGRWQWTSSLYMKYPYKAGDGREDASGNADAMRTIRGGDVGAEMCGPWVSLRGYGAPSSSYYMRFVIGSAAGNQAPASRSQAPTLAPSTEQGTSQLGPSFDCETDRQPDDRAICSNADLAAKDRRMASLYSAARSRLSQDRQNELKASQREWLGARRLCGNDVACLRELYDQRIRQLTELN